LAEARYELAKRDREEAFVAALSPSTMKPCDEHSAIRSAPTIRYP
jgi:hypothetical protein